jgi:hypothetical protein
MMGKVQSTKTWADLAEFIQDIHQRSGGVPNASTYKTLGNQALMLISDEAQCYKQVWTNAVDGGLTITGNSIAIPADCLSPESLEWDGLLMRRTTRDELDEDDMGWRTCNGVPSHWHVDTPNIVMDRIPEGVVTGKLTLRGTGTLPEFSDDPDDDNPLAYLPARFQIAPAYYVLAELPADLDNKSDAMRKQEYTEKWERERALLVAGLRKRNSERFEY